VNSSTGIMHALRTMQPGFAAVSAANHYEVSRLRPNCDAGARDQLTIRVTGSTLESLVFCILFIMFLCLHLALFSFAFI